MERRRTAPAPSLVQIPLRGKRLSRRRPPLTLWFTEVICMDTKTDGPPLLRRRPRDAAHPGARASRPHWTWQDGYEPCKGGLGAPCKGLTVDERLPAAITSRAGPTRERGRLARIRPGKMDTNPAKEGSLRFTRKWPRMAGVAPTRLRAGPTTAPLRPRPQRSGRRGRRVLHPGETEQHATQVHAGGTPALPGGVPLPIAPAPRGGTRRLAGPQPCRCGRAVTLGGPWRIILFSLVAGKVSFGCSNLSSC